MTDEKRLRARAQYFGPDMLKTISETIARVDRELGDLRDLDKAGVAALLMELVEPLEQVQAQVEDTDRNGHG